MSVVVVGSVALVAVLFRAKLGAPVLVAGVVARRRLRRDVAAWRAPSPSSPTCRSVADVGARSLGMIGWAGVLGSVVARSIVPVVAAAAAIAGVVYLGRRAVVRRRVAFDDALPDHVEQLARALRTGRTIRESLDVVVAPDALADDIGRLRRDMASGTPLGESLERWSGRSTATGVPMVVAVLRLGDGLGGSLAAALDDCAHALRDRLEVRDETRALTSQARASAWCVAVLPIGAAGLLSMVDPGVGTVLVGTPLGAACILGALVLDGAAVWWMSRLIGEVS